MTLPRRRHAALIVSLALTAPLAGGQELKTWLALDGSTNDETGFTTQAVSGGTPIYAADRFGNGNSAWSLNGSSDYLTLGTSTTPGNSALDLGFKGAFTASAWIRPAAPASGDNMVFGNPGGGGTGTVHYGLRNSLAQMGMWGNDAAGTTTIEADQWYHMTYQYDGSNQKIFINGILDRTRSAANTTKDANIAIGTAADNGRSYEGRLDDVVVFDGALTQGQIFDVMGSRDPSRLDDCPADPLQGNLGSAGNWGIREIKGHSVLPYDGITNAIAIAHNQSGGTVHDGQRAQINLSDSNSSNNSGNFTPDLSFVSNTGGADNNFIVIGQAFINIPTAGDYTFGFSGDEGARLRIYGQDFTSAVTTAGGNDMDPPFAGDQIIFTNTTGNGTVLGVVNLQPGVYFLEHLWFEGSGGAWTEVYAAQGAKTSFDASFELVGDPASGGLQIVAPQPLIKTFDVDANVISGGSPANITFTWDTIFGDSFSINNGVGGVSGGSKTIAAPSTTTTYTLTANHSGGGSSTAQVTVTVDPPPIITSFAADDDTVASGSPVTLSWETIAGVTFILHPGNINVTGNTSGQTGSRVVNPTSTTAYTLTVSNINGSSDSDPVTVTVGTGPTINSFSVNDSSPAPGAVLTLDWDVLNTDTLTIDPDVGDVTSLGQAFVCPSNDTTYTLTASNGFGSVTAQVSVTTAEPVGASAAGFTVRFAASTGTVNTLALADNALAGNNLASAITTLSNVPSINYVDSGTAGEVAGDVNFPPGYVNHFAMEATGTLVVNVAGTYTFAINNDDGGRLKINGNTVINDDATHGPTTSTGSATLSAGNHTIEYVFFEATGGAAAELFLQPQPGIANLLEVTGNLGNIVTPTVIINEIMADNDNDVIVDGDGDASDWIELYNGTGTAVDISGWHLTDDPLLLNKWAFPAATIIPDGGHLLVWASDKALGIPPAGELHTNFKLSPAGEYLALVAANGSTIVHEITPAYPVQSNGVSWGTYDTEQFTGYFVGPTPGGRNSFGYDGLVGDTTFSHDRGFYDSTFQLSITSSTPGAVIYYTTNGDEPTDKNATVGTVYTGPITVDETTVIRARATKPGFFPSNVDTQTYIFTADVVNQDDAHAHGLGFPDMNVNGQRFEYGMNLTAGGGAAAVETALEAVPTISLVLDQDDFSGPSGIYVNPGSRGLERAGSIELLNEDGMGLGQFQENCGVRIRGGFSRSTNNPKHAFRLFFRKTYGAGKLNYSLFGDEGENSFDGVDLRTSQNYSWAFQNSNQNTFLREVWGRDTQREMGQPYTRSRYYHLYINGHYWGLYMTQERAEADYGETYLGGVDDDYDTIKSAGSSGGYRTETTDGDFGDWNMLWDWDNGSVSANPSNANYFAAQGLQSDGVTPNGGPVLLDVDNLADYMLTIFYDGSFDAPLSTFLNNASNNWFSVRNRVSDDRGFAFFIHDNEHGMGSANDSRSDNRTGPWGGVYNTIDDQDRSNPQYIHEDLAHNAEYRLAFADRAHAALVAPGGPLTLTEAKARISARAVTVETVIDAEAARWGSTSLNKAAWIGARDRLLDWVDDGDSSNGGPDRTQVVLTQLRSYSDGALYPSLDAPVYSQQGGNVPGGFSLTMTNPDGVGTIYYTLDGSDPRVPVTGAVSGTAYTGAIPLNATTTVRARIRNGSTWSALNDATFLVGNLADASNLVISQIYYNAPGSNELGEYIEVMNISGVEIELAGLTFTSGLTFDFSSATDTTLDAGERAVIVADETTFNAVFSAYLPVHILGTYIGSLSNSGERIALLDAAGGTIRDFDYNDKAPWPESPDGDGAALVLIDPTSNPDHALPTSWRPSNNITGGTPGTSTTEDYGTWKTANGVSLDNSDDDGDELDALAEYGFGGDPNLSDSDGILPTASVQAFTVGVSTDDYLTIEFRLNLDAEDVAVSVDVSTDLTIWNTGPAFVLEVPPASHNGDGTETVTYRSTDPIPSDLRLFIRATVTTLP